MDARALREARELGELRARIRGIDPNAPENRDLQNDFLIRNVVAQVNFGMPMQHIARLVARINDDNIPELVESDASDNEEENHVDRLKNRNARINRNR